ncbi:HAD-IIB family hydrolase [Candidatus Saccharibacteria bacterium]|nr:HAD-IIB family hydrolase [Candidatus Saccharibacteria bacterium]
MEPKKKILAFDIDMTLSPPKQPITEDIAGLLVPCLDYFEICPISGQRFEQFKVQILGPLRNVSPNRLRHLHLLPAQGTQYYRYSASTQTWVQMYNHTLTEDQVARITKILEYAAKETGYWEEDKLLPGDRIIENRLSQVTFSGIGQKAHVSAKTAWDPDCKKREAIIKICRELEPEFNYAIGGSTSIDTTPSGMNKGTGLTNFLFEVGMTKEDILFFGDMTQPGGNDYPVIQADIDAITVRSPEDTVYALRGILGLYGVL